MYWISFVDARGRRQRKPGAQSWEEARQMLAETLSRVKEEASLKPGEVLACLDSFAAVCGVLGITDIRLHDLRHTFATWLRQNGIELDVIASQLGHRDLRMTKRYARIASVQVKQAVSGLDSMLGAAPEAETSDVSHPFVTGAPALPEANSVTH